MKIFAWSEHKTFWSIQGKKHSVEYLLEHLLYIIRDSALNNKPKTKPSVSILIVKTLPSLVFRNADVCAKEEDDEEELIAIERKFSDIRKELTHEGKGMECIQNNLSSFPT